MNQDNKSSSAVGMGAMKLSRRAFLASALSLPLVGGSLAGYMIFWEPEWYEVTEKHASIGRLKNALRILHLSDFHASEFVSLDTIASAVEVSLSLKPDLAVLTGDFITTDLSQEESYRAILSRISQRCPTFACVGNHDGGPWAILHNGYPSFEHVQRLLESSNIEFLFNRAVTAKVRGETLDIIGLGDYWSHHTRPEGLMEPVRSADRPVLVLCHNPDAKEVIRNFDWDILFCGHTHGGQLVIPLTGLRPFLPIKDKRFAEGLIPYDGRLVHVTRGVGNLHGMRFNCRPEISIVTVS